MNVLLILIPVSIALLAVAVYAFFWAVDHEQLEDFDTARLLPMLDADKPPGPDATDRPP